MESFDTLKKFKNNVGTFKIVQSSHANDGNKKITSEYKIFYNETRPTNRHKTSSGVWKHFALATKCSSTSTNPDEDPDDRILCMLCYAKGRIHVYKSKTSSSNLWRHLNRQHNIEIPTEKMFTIIPGNFEEEFSGDTEEGVNSNDDRYSSINIDENENENDETLIKTDYEEINEYQPEPLIQIPGEVKQDIGLAVIEEVSKRPILYESQINKSSSTWNSKKAMWAEICDALGGVIQVDRIQKIWKNIRDRYRKIRLNENEGIEENTPKYKYYDHLRFLDEIIERDYSFEVSSDEPLKKKPRTEELSFFIDQGDGILCSVDGLYSNEQNLSSENVISENNACMVSSSNRAVAQNTIFPLETVISDTEDDSKNESANTSPAISKSENLDEFDLFGKFIANKLRNAPKDRVNLLEVKIMQAIFENI